MLTKKNGKNFITDIQKVDGKFNSYRFTGKIVFGNTNKRTFNCIRDSFFVDSSGLSSVVIFYGQASTHGNKSGPVRGLVREARPNEI